MRLFTPKSLAYPITVTKILCRVGADIEQNAPLFTYQYKSTNSEWDDEAGDYVEKERTYFSDFESEVEGNISVLNIEAEQVIRAPIQVADIEEPCKHEIQFGGMCANCGKDMTVQQYNTTTLNTARATVNTVHGHTALLISREEASRADEEAKRRLLDARKLSLVVDLDQTVIHATVDPTVGDWQKDPTNPNYNAVKDVRAFQLIDDGPGGRGTWYYIKLRPGLSAFLEAMGRIYELHIYTMATRAYAENIAKIVDPDRKLFGERILSRDENGSMSSKNLKRLFPVDTKMVVIIDDRGDVWSWSPNLVKVVPYDFFVGIGDINSSFLPKRPELEARPAKPSRATVTAAEEEEGGTILVNGHERKPSTDHLDGSSSGDVSTVDRMMNMAGNQDETTLHQQTDEQDKTITAQKEERPLERMQKILDQEEVEAKTSPAVTAVGELLSGETEKQNGDDENAHHPKYRHNLLQDDDDELDHLERSLRSIHTSFFEEYDRDTAGARPRRSSDIGGSTGATKNRPSDDLDTIPDAAVIMASMKAKVLQGVHIVLSGVIPIGVDIESHDIVVWARSFGATVTGAINKRTTHLIASPERRTAKVRQAVKRDNRIAIVNQNWLYACFSQWRHVEEAPYRVHSDAPSQDPAGLPDSFEGRDGVLSSSDSDAARTEDETDPGGDQTPMPPAELDDEMMELQKHAPRLDRRDSSPTESEQPDNWQEIEDDVNEFLGSGWDDDTDAESESEQPQDSSSSTISASNEILALRKRKRDDRDDEENPGGGANLEDGGSRLQKRKNEALGRTTSLTNVTVPGDFVDDDGQDGDDESGRKNLRGAMRVPEIVENDDFGDDDLEAALEAEMMKQMDEDQDM